MPQGAAQSLVRVPTLSREAAQGETLLSMSGTAMGDEEVVAGAGAGIDAAAGGAASAAAA